MIRQYGSVLCLLAIGLCVIPFGGQYAAAGAFVDRRALSKEQDRAKGCAAVVSYLIVNSTFPERNISLDQILDDLPFDRFCSAADIARTLRKYDLQVAAVKTRPSDSLPPPGSWNILLDTRKPEGHWYAVCRNNADTVTYYGMRSPVDFRRGTYEEAVSNFQKIEQGMLAPDDASAPGDKRVVVVLEVRKASRLSSYLALSTALLLLLLVAAGCIWKRTRVKHILRLSCSVLFFMAAGNGAWADGPKILIDRKAVDLGIIMIDHRAERPRHTVPFRISNQGTSPLTIASIQLSCSCSSYTLTRDVIPAGESAELAVTLDLRQGSERTEVLVVRSNDPVLPAIPLKMRYSAPMLYGIQPSSSSVSIDQEDRGAAVTVTRPVEVSILKELSDYYRPLRIESDRPAISATERGSKIVTGNVGGDEASGPEYVLHKYDVAVDPAQCTDDETGGDIRFVFDHGLVLTHPVSVMVIPSITVVPSKMIFTAPHQRKTLTLTVRRDVLVDPSKPIDAALARPGRQDISCAVIEREPGYLTMQVTMADTLHLEHDQIDLVTTNVQDIYSTVSIPVRILALGAPDNSSSAKKPDADTEGEAVYRENPEPELSAQPPSPGFDVTKVGLLDLEQQYGKTLDQALRENKYVAGFEWRTFEGPKGRPVYEVAGQYDLTKSPEKLNPAGCISAGFVLQFEFDSGNVCRPYGSGENSVKKDRTSSEVLLTVSQFRDVAMMQARAFSDTPSESSIESFEKSVREIFFRNFRAKVQAIYRNDLF